MAYNCYNQCITQETGGCHCYSTKYQTSQLEDEANPKQFMYCPGVHCTIKSCEEWCDGETGGMDNYTHNNCCNST